MWSEGSQRIGDVRAAGLAPELGSHSHLIPSLHDHLSKDPSWNLVSSFSHPPPHLFSAPPRTDPKGLETMAPEAEGTHEEAPQVPSGAEGGGSGGMEEPALRASHFSCPLV